MRLFGSSHTLISQLRHHVSPLATLVLDTVFPPVCMACRKPTSAVGTLCAPCWSGVRFIERPFCERLGTPFAQDLGAGLLSPQAIADPPVYRRARAVARFEDGPIRQMIHRLKSSDRMEMAEPMGRWMARAGAELFDEANLLIPVPLHRGRLARRRFNQAALLTKVIAKLSGLPADLFALERVKATPPQVGFSRSQRALNMQGAFRASPEGAMRISQRNIVLIDDVLTSGATTNAAARALLRAGALSVDVLVFARVVTDA